MSIITKEEVDLRMKFIEEETNPILKISMKQQLIKGMIEHSQKNGMLESTIVDSMSNEMLLEVLVQHDPSNIFLTEVIRRYCILADIDTNITVGSQ